MIEIPFVFQYWFLIKLQKVMINRIHSNTFEGGLYPREFTIECCKIPKICPGAYIFFKPLFEGLISGGPYLRREICVSKSIGLVYNWKEFTVFALFYLVFEGNFQEQAPVGAYIWRDDLTQSFLCYEFGRLIFGGAYAWRGLFSEFYGIFFV